MHHLSFRVLQEVIQGTQVFLHSLEVLGWGPLDS